MAEQKPPCRRCGEPTPTYDFERESTFWGAIEHETQTVVTRRVRVLNHYWRRNPPLGGSEHLVADERSPLCSECSGLLVGRFLQGRDVPALSSVLPNSGATPVRHDSGNGDTK